MKIKPLKTYPQRRLARCSLIAAKARSCMTLRSQSLLSDGVCLVLLFVDEKSPNVAMVFLSVYLGNNVDHIKRS